MEEPKQEELKQEEEQPKELVPLTEEQQQEEQQIERWYYRMERYPISLPDPVKYMAARMAVAYGLDPFLGEMVFIPQYKDRKLAGYQPYVGIGGLRRAARRTGEYGGRELRPCTDEEREALQVDKDAHAWFCQVWRKGIEKPFDGFGIFPMHDKDLSKAPPWRMARKRAEHAALRAAFDLELQLMEIDGLVVEEKAVEGEVKDLPREELKAELEQVAEQAEEEIAKLEAEEAGEEPAEEITPTEPVEEEDPTQEELFAWAKKKGLASGVVKQVLEDKGGAIDETLLHLKGLHGE